MRSRYRSRRRKKVDYVRITFRELENAYVISPVKRDRFGRPIISVKISDFDAQRIEWKTNSHLIVPALFHELRQVLEEYRKRGLIQYYGTPYRGVYWIDVLFSRDTPEEKAEKIVESAVKEAARRVAKTFPDYVK